MTLPITPVTQTVAAQAATLDVALQPGTVVTAQVLKLLDANLVRLAIASLTLDVATTVPLQAGQTLQLAVTQTKDGLSLLPVSPDTASATRGNVVITDDIALAAKSPTQDARFVLSSVETRAVAVAAQVAATKQTGLSPLFANLTAAVASRQLPKPVLLAAAQLLALRQPSDKALTGGDIKTALTSSGLLLEPSLAATTSSVSQTPDIKAALSVLRQTLATWLGPAAESSSGHSSGAQATSPPQGTATSTASALRPTENAHAEVALTVAVAAKTETSDPILTVKTALPNQPSQNAALTEFDDGNPPARNATTPPPFRGALPTAQPVASPTLAADAEPIIVARQLLADSDGALARQTLLQIASLPDRADMTTPRIETLQPRWNFEIPFVTARGTAMAQFEIARDGSGNESEASWRVWRARFSLDIEPAGPVHALISLSGETTSVKMWAERPATAAQLRANAFHLGASLDRAEVKAGDIVVTDGRPTHARAPGAGHFLNRAS